MMELGELLYKLRKPKSPADIVLEAQHNPEKAEELIKHIILRFIDYQHSPKPTGLLQHIDEAYLAFILEGVRRYISSEGKSFESAFYLSHKRGPKSKVNKQELAARLRAAMKNNKYVVAQEEVAVAHGVAPSTVSAADKSVRDAGKSVVRKLLEKAPCRSSNKKSKK